jgi:hypothetical protein
MLQTNLTGALEYRNYLDGHFDNSTRGQLNGLVGWSLLPQRLTWSFQDNLGVQPIDEFSPDTPDNQQQTNAFATGPTILFGLGKSLQGQLDLRYINSYAEKTSEFDTHRYSGALQIRKDLSTTSHLSGNIQAQKVDLLHPNGTPDFSRYDAYLDYTRTLASFDFDLAAGYSTLDYQGNLGNSQGPLLRGSMNWRPTARSSYSFLAARQYTDAADSMLNGYGPNPGSQPQQIATGDVTTTAQAYLERRIQFGYAFQGARLNLSLAPYYRRLEYINISDYDQTSHGATAGLSWLLQPRMRVNLYAMGENLRYDSIARSDHTRNYTAGFDYQWTRRLSWHASLSRFERHSTVAGQTSSQNVVYFWVTFNR